MSRFSLEIAKLLSDYRTGSRTPLEVIDDVLMRIDTDPDRRIWIQRLDRTEILRYVDALAEKSPDDFPLYGIPFAIKDNIDLAGVPTTAGCPEFAYTPSKSATVVQKLIDAGAVPIGKTNLDQFATGLVGTRSPYGETQNSFDENFISGGSSGGSAVAVATSLVSFSLGTDTAGSGRVPAAFNNLIGLKPSVGLVSTVGVVPACRTLDCVSVFALNAADARRVLRVIEGVDPADAFSRTVQRCAFSIARFRFGVPRVDQLEFFGNKEYERLFAASIARLESLGGRRVEIDFEPFAETARLLYEGPWVAERFAAIESFIATHAHAIFPVTRQIIEGAKGKSAIDAFKAMYRLAELRRATASVWRDIDVMLAPTAGTHYTIDQVNADPIRLNSNLGRYTNFVNLLDLAALAIPAGFCSNGLPFGITFVAPSGSDEALLRLAERVAGNPEPKLAVAPGFQTMAVCGAHMEGLPLNSQLTDRRGYFIARTQSAAKYRLYALPGGPPARPGMVRVNSNGAAIEVEVWAIPTDTVGSFLAGIPAPLGLGTVELADGSLVTGFTCESSATEGARDITSFGGWRAFLASSAS